MTNKKKKTIAVTENRFGVLLESMASDIKQVLEGHAALDTKFDKKFHELKLEARDLKLGQKDIMRYLSRIDDEIQDIKKSLTQKADLQRLERLEKEVAQIKLAMQKWQK